MRYHVPQFIEIEDKVIGPLTIKQFIYVAGGVGTIALFQAFMPLTLAIIIGGPILVLGLALAFYRINDQPFIVILEAAFFYLFRKRLYLWQKRAPEGGKAKVSEAKAGNANTPYVPNVSSNKLKKLAWSLDVKEGKSADKTGL